MKLGCRACSTAANQSAAAWMLLRQVRLQNCAVTDRGKPPPIGLSACRTHYLGVT
jgi:hypothetical protein